MNSNSVYIISEKKFGQYLNSAMQSGYSMDCIKVNGVVSYYYPSDVLFVRPMTNSQLWKLIEAGNIPKGMTFINQEEKKISFDGITLVPMNFATDFVCCKDDMWTMVEN